MSNDPLVIPLSKLTDLLRGFGLVIDDIREIREVHIMPSGIEVVRFRQDENGHRVVVGDNVATETVTIRLEHSR
jgi:hypothetical protein